jgi:hypothetical protein
VSARDAQARDRWSFLGRRFTRTAEAKKRLLQADGGSVTIALTRQNSAKQNTGLLKEAAPPADESRKEFDSYFGFSEL